MSSVVISLAMLLPCRTTDYEVFVCKQHWTSFGNTCSHRARHDYCYLSGLGQFTQTGSVYGLGRELMIMHRRHHDYWISSSAGQDRKWADRCSDSYWEWIRFCPVLKSVWHLWRRQQRIQRRWRLVMGECGKTMNKKFVKFHTVNIADEVETVEHRVGWFHCLSNAICSDGWIIKYSSTFICECFCV